MAISLRVQVVYGVAYTCILKNSKKQQSNANHAYYTFIYVVNECLGIFVYFHLSLLLI